MSHDLRERAKKFYEKLKNIKLFLMDADGILTNGLIYYSGEEVGFNRYFHVHDGYILKVLGENGIKVGIISGGDSVGLNQRCDLLQLEYRYLGNEDKRLAYLDIMKRSGLEDHEILYMGDELFDLPLLKRVGFSATVPNAPLEVREAVDYVTTKNGGEGAVREVADILRYAQNIYPHIPDFDEL